MAVSAMSAEQGHEIYPVKKDGFRRKLMILRALLKMIEKMVRFWSALEIRGDWLIFRQSTESETLAAGLLLLPDLRRCRPNGLRVTGI